MHHCLNCCLVWRLYQITCFATKSVLMFSCTNIFPFIPCTLIKIEPMLFFSHAFYAFVLHLILVVRWSCPHIHRVISCLVLSDLADYMNNTIVCYSYFKLCLLICLYEWDGIDSTLTMVIYINAKLVICVRVSLSEY